MTDQSTRAIVFDFDGVLSDSESAHEQTLLRTAESHGLTFTHDQYIDAIIGFDDRDAFAYIARLCEQTLSPDTLRQLQEEKTQHFEDMVRSGEVGLFEGAADLAKAAKQAGPVAICSGALRNEILMILEAGGLSGHFEVIVTADDVPAAKPDPTGYLIAAELLGVDPRSCITIEDTPTGLSAARQAGYKLAAVGTSAPRQALEPLDLYRDSISEYSVEDLLAVFDQ